MLKFVDITFKKNIFLTSLWFKFHLCRAETNVVVITLICLVSNSSQKIFSPEFTSLILTRFCPISWNFYTARDVSWPTCDIVDNAYH